MTKNQTPVTSLSALLPKTAKTTDASWTARCRCGCGEATSSKSTLYKPGHDARHVGVVARDIVASSQEGHERTTADSDLGSEKLQAKALAMAERLLQRAAEKGQTAERKLAKKTTKLAKADSLAATVAQEEAEHAAQSTPPEPEWEDGEVLPEPQSGEVKLGRWTYPTRTFQDGTVLRNAKRDGSGEWVAL